MSSSTLFDMASCTKVVATTSVVALLYQKGMLPLEQRLSDPLLLGPSFAQAGKENVTVLNCLLHNAGFPPDPSPNYWDPSFGCPETPRPGGPLENWSCRERVYAGLLAQTLNRPVGASYVYSDLSFISLMFAAGRTVQRNAAALGLGPGDLLPGCADGNATRPDEAQCWFEAFARLRVFAPLGMNDTAFLPPRAEWGRAAPCENDTVYEQRVIQGQVSDGNAYALGGVSGHAGLFSTVDDSYRLMREVMFGQESGRFLNATTVRLFTTEYNHTQSSRALGWNTNDPTVFDEGWGLMCGTMGPRTFMHIGYTGTQVCGDPDRGLLTVFHTNRVYPNATNFRIEKVRKAFHTAVVTALDAAAGQQGNGKPHAAAVAAGVVACVAVVLLVAWLACGRKRRGGPGPVRPLARAPSPRAKELDARYEELVSSLEETEGRRHG